jgi:aquaporin Z
MALIYAFADVSGAHFNPVITFAFALRRDFPWRRVPGYIAAQFIGALLASWALLGMFGGEIICGATTPAPEITPIAAMFTEAVLTALLALIILGTASGAKIVGHRAAIAVGAFVIVAGLLGGPVSGGSMNPARSLGPDIVRLNFDTSWIYVLGPLLGVLIAVLVAQVLRGRRSKTEEKAALGH